MVNARWSTSARVLTFRPVPPPAISADSLANPFGASLALEHPAVDPTVREVIMVQRYTVLRTLRRFHTGDPFGGPPSAAGAELPRAAAAAEPQVDVADLTPANIHDLARDPAVAAIAPIMPTKLVEPLEVPAGAAAKTAWGIGAVRADQSAFTGAGVAVAVLDTGIDANHPAFQGVTLVQQDFSGSGNGDVNGHGTHCAGTIFGRDVSGDRIGVARGVTRALIGKVLGNDGGGQSDWIFQAIQWALNNGARVVSMSLGFDFPGYVSRLVQAGWPVDLATSAGLEAYRANLRMFDALMGLVRARRDFDGGAVVVAAAGNESRRQINPDFEIATSLPAAAEGVLSVGALDRSGGAGFSVAPFSNTLPDISGPGVAILSARAGGGLRELSGTSMATPHVAGVAALWWQHATSVPAPVTYETVTARMLAAARPNVFAQDVDVADRGVGIVTAP
jgi:subtilisin family serine protease